MRVGYSNPTTLMVKSTVLKVFYFNFLCNCLQRLQLTWKYIKNLHVIFISSHPIPHLAHNIIYIYSVLLLPSLLLGYQIQMGCLGWKYQLFCLLVLLSLLFHLPSSFSSSLSSISPCSALLHFSHALSLDLSASPSYYTSRIHMCDISYPKTASWKEDKDCCTWDGVVCHQTTRHVIGLDLSCSWLRGPIHSNSTLFFLPHLRTLNLAGNCFNESLISPEFGKFKALTHLNLSYSCFSGKIPYEISHLSSLVSLDLSFNDELLIETPVWKSVIHNLTQLRELLLDQSDMSSIRPNSLMNLSSSFTTLSLNYCKLQGKLENSILCLPSIQTLDLGFNINLDMGSLPKSNWSSYLQFLDLSSVSFSGKLPDSIGNLKSLKYLDFSNCNFTGSILTSLENLTKLTYLALSSNNFNGEIQLSLLNFSCFWHTHELTICFNYWGIF